jgi:hypothetical protein
VTPKTRELCCCRHRTFGNTARKRGERKKRRDQKKGRDGRTGWNGRETEDRNARNIQEAEGYEDFHGIQAIAIAIEQNEKQQRNT